MADTTLSGRQHLHRGAMRKGQLRVGSNVVASVESERRRLTALNHSATHLLHAALRRVLGTHVQQKGSLVSPEHLRFDFSHALPVTENELREIESIVNREIQQNTPVQTELLGYQEAIEKGAMALFGEKYGDRVRVLTMGDGFSVELCGGTHVRRTGDIGLLRIVSESGIAAGVRRIEALTGPAALAFSDAAERDLRAIAELLKASRRDVVDKVKALLSQHRDLQRETDQLKQRAAASRGVDLAETASELRGVRILAAQVQGDDPKALLGTLDALKSKLGSAVIVLGAGVERQSRSDRRRDERRNRSCESGRTDRDGRAARWRPRRRSTRHGARRWRRQTGSARIRARVGRSLGRRANLMHAARSHFRCAGNSL